MFGSRIHKHKLTVQRGDALAHVAVQIYETGHEFDFAAAMVIAHAGNKTDHEFIEAWASDENAVDRFIDLAPADIALRRQLRADGTGG
ncbi:unnamed protein product [Dibothriocephalus latus]|uniref:Uncharacterized protein n=1 Tax=Dibothriocephalus latus TaxID=60516 RepID=A0A3P6U186_DIBLA|nr:unnamed protein product [Dibothriocephalus latus]